MVLKDLNSSLLIKPDNIHFIKKPKQGQFIQLKSSLRECSTPNTNHFYDVERSPVMAAYEKCSYMYAYLHSKKNMGLLEIIKLAYFVQNHNLI